MFTPFTVGIGFTVMVTVNVLPTQAPAAPEVGVTVYKTSCGVNTELVNVWLISFWGAAWFEAPVTDGLLATVQVYVVFTGTMVVPLWIGEIENDDPLQIVWTAAGIVGFGCTVTVSKKVFPTQLPVVGVTLYTITWSILVVLTKAWLILFWGTVTLDCPVIKLLFVWIL